MNAKSLKILKIHSVAKGIADGASVISIAGDLDNERDIIIHLSIEDWEKIVRNADWFRGRIPG